MDLLIELRVRVIPLDSMLSGMNCPDCSEPLNLHQPDESAPDQLLATCDGCTRWFAIHGMAGRGDFQLMIQVPGYLQIESLLAEQVPPMLTRRRQPPSRSG